MLESTKYAAALFILLSFAASANEGKDLFDLSLEELLQVRISSAGKADESIRNIPASVSVITRSEIERYGYSTFTELLRNTPGLYYLTNLESDFIGIRGNASGRIQVLVNGIPQHPSLQKELSTTDINQYNIPMGSIDRVEIIRGPMSVIYGNNAFHGVINVITNNADRQPAVATTTVGTKENRSGFSRYSAQGENGYFLVNAGVDHIGSVDGSYEVMLDSATFADLHPDADQSLKERTNRKQTSIDISAGFKSLSSNLRYQHSDNGAYLTSPGFERSGLKISTVHLSLVYEHFLNDHLQLRATSIYSKETYDLPSFSLMRPTVDGFQKQKNKRKDLELNLIHNKGSNQLVSGYRFRRIDGVKNTAFVSTDPTDPELTITDFEHALKPYSSHELFTQNSYQLNDSNRLIAGLRYLYINNNFKRIRKNNVTNTTTREQAPLDDKHSYTWRLAFLHDLNPNNQVKFMAGTAEHDSDNFSFPNPEEILTYEINHLVTGEYFQLSSSVFQNKAKNILQRELDPISLDAETTQNGQWKTLGIEVVGNYRYCKHWRFDASVTLQKTEDEDSRKEIGYSPKALMKFKVDYTRGPFSAAAYINHVSSMQTSFTYDSSHNSVDRLGKVVPAYQLIGLNGRYAYPHGLFFNLNISNLLDEEVRYPANEVIENMEQGLIGHGRIIHLGMGYEF